MQLERGLGEVLAGHGIKFFSKLKQFAPFGPGNMNPVFRVENVRDTGMSRIVGNNHIKLNLAEDENTRFGFDGIAFQMGQEIQVQLKTYFDAAPVRVFLPAHYNLLSCILLFDHYY